MKYKRNIAISELLKKKSILLLGPRSTGKSFYIRNELEDVHYINLLKSSEFLLLSSDPTELENIVKYSRNKTVVIDEIQKVPALLDEVHRLIEEYGTRFLLTGSSARKLKSHGVNLLAGRAWLARMHPLNFFEINDLEKNFDLNKYIQFGSLPQVWTSDYPKEELDNYLKTYIEQEIKAEGIIRKIPAFSRFIKTAALNSGEILNFQNIASDSRVPASTVKEHYQILEDTLIGYNLEPWLESKKRKAIATSKFYFFDVGVLNFISKVTPVSEGSTEWGKRFKHFIINELRCINSYQRRRYDLNYWRSTAGHEVDLLFGESAIEIKSTKSTTTKHLKGLKALKEEEKFKNYYLISRDQNERLVDGIECVYYKNFLSKAWNGSY
ncbi:MAG: ATP-binding protein [Bacteriovoracaceae bacterium]|nr:ATP-binding protein [Bacteriovoracaceae bacterium]